VLLRHGESTCSVKGLIGGVRGCTGLTRRGVRQVEQLRDRLAETRELEGAACLYSSVLPRAIETAQIVSPALGGLEVKTDCGLCELHPGECDGLSWAEFRELNGEPDFSSEPHKPLSPGGESWAGFLERVEASLRALADRHPGDIAVVACHGGVIDGSLIRFLGIGRLGTRLALGTANCSITEWEVSGGRWRLVRYNDTAHAPREGRA
jgi:probable phosphoglycerate mutase